MKKYLAILAIEKWDGKLPVYSGEATPMIQLPKQGN